MTFIKLIPKIATIISITSISFFACKKNTSNNKPVLNFKSVSTYELKQKQSVTIFLKCDKIDLSKGDLKDSLGVQFVVLNQASCTGPSGVKKRTTMYELPAFSSNAGSTDLEINWINNAINPTPGSGLLPATNCRPIDTTMIKFWLKTKTGIYSDTITLDRPIAIYN